MDAGQRSPSDPAQWTRDREFYHTAKLTAYAVQPAGRYAYAAVDITSAYNNLWSRNAHGTAKDSRKAGTSNRSFRVRKAVRHFLWVPRGTAAYVVVYDQIISTNPGFTKKVLIHSINQPSLAGNSYTISRTELATSRPFPNLWPQLWASQITNCPGGCSGSSTQYQYNGKLYGWMTLPSGGSLTNVGGAGHEFDITDSAGTTNWNECMIGQCTTGAGGTNNEGLGGVTGFINSDPTSAPTQPGAWRIEQTPASAALDDKFLNVMLVTSASDTNTVSTVPGTSVSGTNYVTTWKDNSNQCTYTYTAPINGVGGTLTIQETVAGGCVGGTLN
jgi:hypothetical protein